jgi:acyl-CoA thioester hydrolase
MSALGGVEVWRGGVNTWECDVMGHMNVRFYVARAMDGLVGLASALGLSGAFRERANATLLVKDHHIRFLREAQAGAPLHMVAGVLDIGECEARFLQLLVHSTTGELAASFQTVVAHATAQEERSFAWSHATRAAAERLRITIPERAAPRSLGLAPSAALGCLADANAFGLVPLGVGAIGVADCDVFGRARPEVIVGRVSDGVSGLAAVLRAGPDQQTYQRAPGIGGAVLEYRIAYLAWPRAGDRYVIRSGLAAVDDKTQNYIHWILDPETGRAWGSSEAVAISLDLTARKIVPLSPSDQALLRTRITPGLSF